MNPLGACKVVDSHFVLDTDDQTTRSPLGCSQFPLMPFQSPGNLLALLEAMNCVEGGCVAGEGNEGDSMDEAVPCVHVDEEVDTCTVVGSPLDPPGDDVDLDLGEAEDTGILHHSASEGNPDASEHGAGTQEEVVGDVTRWLDYRAHWATAREAMAADLAACPSIASSELVAMLLESISKEREKSKKKDPGDSLMQIT
jgi:hypothetical protein